jgi:hypothetical protein
MKITFLVLVLAWTVFMLPANILRIQGQPLTPTRYIIAPALTDAKATATNDSHYVFVNRSVPAQNKLFVFIGGTGSNPRNIQLICNAAANAGLHVINIAYPNSLSIVQACSNSNDTSCFRRFREEAIYGTPVSSDIMIDTANSIVNRLIKLLMYISRTNPTESWGQFLEGNQLKWTEIIVAGHSQGAGHAVFLAYTQQVYRCIAFSGPNDYSGLLNQPAAWFANSKKTPISAFYAFLHLQDETPFSSQVRGITGQIFNLQRIGILSDTVQVDNTRPPYRNARLLYSAIQPRVGLGIARNHNSTVVDANTPLMNGLPTFAETWNYLLGTNEITSITADPATKPVADTIYPNPASKQVTVRGLEGTSNLVLTNLLGQMVLQQRVSEQTTTLDISLLPSGVYMLSVHSATTHFAQPVQIVR